VVCFPGDAPPVQPLPDAIRALHPRPVAAGEGGEGGEGAGTRLRVLAPDQQAVGGALPRVAFDRMVLLVLQARIHGGGNGGVQRLNAEDEAAGRNHGWRVGGTAPPPPV